MTSSLHRIDSMESRIAMATMYGMCTSGPHSCSAAALFYQYQIAYSILSIVTTNNKYLTWNGRNNAHILDHGITGNQATSCGVSQKGLLQLNNSTIHQLMMGLCPAGGLCPAEGSVISLFTKEYKRGRYPSIHIRYWWCSNNYIKKTCRVASIYILSE